MEDKRAAILAATLDLISEYGLQSTPMSKIAKQSGVAVGTIYHHFESKEALVAALFQELWLKLNQFALKDYDSAQPVRKRFSQVWTNLALFCLQKPREFLFIEQYMYSPYISHKAKQADPEFEQTLYQIYLDGQEQGIIKTYDPEFLIQLTNGALSALIKGHIAGKLVFDNTAIGPAIDACWDAIKR